MLTFAGLQGMWKVAKWYTQFGLMAGSVFRDVLQDLELEGLDSDADSVRGDCTCLFRHSRQYTPVYTLHKATPHPCTQELCPSNVALIFVGQTAESCCTGCELSSARAHSSAACA
jgi:hypothetical protein